MQEDGPLGVREDERRAIRIGGVAEQYPIPRMRDLDARGRLSAVAASSPVHAVFRHVAPPFNALLPRYEPGARTGIVVAHVAHRPRSAPLTEIELAGPDAPQKRVPLAASEHQNGAGIVRMPYRNFPADFSHLDTGHRLTAMATPPPARPDTHIHIASCRACGGLPASYPRRHVGRQRGRAPGRTRLPAPVPWRDGHTGRSSPCTRLVTKAVQLDRVKLRTGPSGSAASRIATASPRSATSTHWPDSPQRVPRRHAWRSLGSSTWFLPPSLVGRASSRAACDLGRPDRGGVSRTACCAGRRRAGRRHAAG
jgi:hypothetical protein